MSNQIVISSGAKVRSLEGVLTGTAGIVNSVPLGGANGVATLDSLGKVPLSQLPASVVTYLGTWNAATNTPTLTNGVGDVGDLYICNVAGTVNFGAGPITFAVGDWVIYSGTEWQKSAGASGTVTSVAVTESGDALTITGSPITTSGTINIGFAGTGSQYIKGDGTLATFPTTIDQAKRLITEVYNSTGATLTKGTVVYINGGQGNLPTVTKAQANADNTSAQTYGVVQSDITNNNNGFVVVIGSLTDIDTQAYAVGTQLYLSGTTAGDWTSTKPSAPIHLVYVGIVVRSHPTQGVVEIRIQNGYELEELHDVAISAPVNNQGIFYNSSNNLWENKSIATALGYTPANDALVVHLAGTETITGVKNFDIGLTLRDGYYPTPATGYIGLASNGSGLTILTKPSATVYNHNLQFQASSNDYNFPAITGVMAMLEGTQTFSGNKTFSALTAFTFLNGTRMDYGLYLSKGSVPSAFSGSTVNLYSDSGNNNLVVRDNSNTSLLQFQAASSYTYTFPAASGTLALTSNLSSYVPYTGATTNVDLGSNFLKARTFYSEGSGGGGSYAIKNGTTPSFEDGYTILSSNDYRLNIVSTVSAATKAVYFGFSGVTATRTYTLPDASGTLALTSNLSSYVPYTGATGAVNLGSNALTALTLYSNAGLGLSNSGQFTGGGGYTGINGRTDGIDIRPNNGGIFQFIFSNTTNRTYTLPDATGTIALTSNLSSYLPLTGGTLTGDLTINNGSADGGQLVLASSGFSDWNIDNFSGNFRWYYGSTERMRLTAAGNLGIGTTSPTGTYGKLSVAGGISILDDNNAKLEIGRYSSGAANSYIKIGANSASLRITNAADSADLVTFTNSGNVGIGTSSPSFRLESLASSATMASFGTSSATGGYVQIKYNTSSINGYIGAGNQLVSGGAVADMALTSDAGNILFATSGGSERMRITSGGQLQVRQDALFGLDFNSTQYIAISENQIRRLGNAILFINNSNTGDVSININGGGTFVNGTNGYGRAVTNSSDIRIKKNISSIDNALNKVLQMNGVYYEFNNENELGINVPSGNTRIGLIAQDIENILPEAVLTPLEENQPKSIDYSGMIGLLINAINELNAKVTALENK